MFIATVTLVVVAPDTWSNNDCYIRGFGITLCHVKSNKAEDARQLAKGSLDLLVGWSMVDTCWTSN
jgi:hypothetical protein